MEVKADGPRERYDPLVRAAQQLPPVTTAVAHPGDKISIEGVVEAAQLGLIAPILVGPPTRIREAAKQAEADISGFPLEESAHSYDSAAKAVELIRQGKAEALVKGSLHTDELMGAVVARETGIRTARRLSHCFCDGCPRPQGPFDHHGCRGQHRPEPRRQGRHRAERDRPRPCAGISGSAGGDHVGDGDGQPRRPVDDRSGCAVQDSGTGQITGGTLDGPLALDNAINEEAAAIKHIVSPVAGRTNVLVVPDLEAGNMLAKSLSFLAGAAAAGIVLGARVPIILTSRADSVITRLASCAVAGLVAEARRCDAAAAIR
jgi:phosphate acetyltransferase